MPRYLVERTFKAGVWFSLTDDGDLDCAAIICSNAKRGVTWVYSYMSDDRQKLFCIYEGPSPEAVREAAHDSNLPIDKITAVRVLDPYFCRG